MRHLLPTLLSVCAAIYNLACIELQHAASILKVVSKSSKNYDKSMDF